MYNQGFRYISISLLFCVVLTGIKSSLIAELTSEDIPCNCILDTEIAPDDPDTIPTWFDTSLGYSCINRNIVINGTAIENITEFGTGSSINVTVDQCGNYDGDTAEAIAFVKASTTGCHHCDYIDNYGNPRERYYSLNSERSPCQIDGCAESYPCMRASDGFLYEEPNCAVPEKYCFIINVNGDNEAFKNFFGDSGFRVGGEYYSGGSLKYGLASVPGTECQYKFPLEGLTSNIKITATAGNYDSRANGAKFSYTISRYGYKKDAIGVTHWHKYTSTTGKVTVKVNKCLNLDFYNLELKPESLKDFAWIDKFHKVGLNPYAQDYMIDPNDPNLYIVNDDDYPGGYIYTNKSWFDEISESPQLQWCWDISGLLVSDPCSMSFAGKIIGNVTIDNCRLDENYLNKAQIWNLGKSIQQPGPDCLSCKQWLGVEQTLYRAKCPNWETDIVIPYSINDVGLPGYMSNDGWSVTYNEDGDSYFKYDPPGSTAGMLVFHCNRPSQQTNLSGIIYPNRLCIEYIEYCTSDSEIGNGKVLWQFVYPEEASGLGADIPTRIVRVNSTGGPVSDPLAGNYSHYSLSSDNGVQTVSWVTVDDSGQEESEYLYSLSYDDMGNISQSDYGSGSGCTSCGSSGSSSGEIITYYDIYDEDYSQDFEGLILERQAPDGTVLEHNIYETIYDDEGQSLVQPQLLEQYSGVKDDSSYAKILDRQYDMLNWRITELRWIDNTSARVRVYQYQDRQLTQPLSVIEYDGLYTVSGGMPVESGYMTTTISQDYDEGDIKRMTVTSQPSGKYQVYRLSDETGRTIESYKYYSGEIIDRIIYSYDSNGNLQTMTDAAGNVTEYDYSGDKIQKELSPPNYDPISGVITQSYTSYSYSGDNLNSQVSGYSLLINESWNDYKLSEVAYNYRAGTGFSVFSDGYGREDSVVQKYYNANGSTVDVIVPSDTYKYDRLGRMVRTIHADGAVSGAEDRYIADDKHRVSGTDYYSNGRVKSEYVSSSSADPNMYVSQTCYVYNTLGQLASVNTALDDSGFMPYNPANGWACTHYVYDEFGRKSEQYQGEVTSLPGSATTYPTVDMLCTRYYYNNQGELYLTLYPTGRYQEVYHNGRGLVSEQYEGYYDNTNIDNRYPEIATTYDYNADGNIEIVSRTGQATVEYVYDDFGRLWKTIKKNITVDDSISAGGVVDLVTENTYDNASRITKEEIYRLADGVRVNESVREMQYDNLGRIWYTRSWAGDTPDDTKDRIEIISYDPAGNAVTRVRVGDPNTVANLASVITMLSGDPNDYTAQEMVFSADDMVSTSTYDSRGNLIEQADPEGNVTNNEYDVFGRLWKTIAPDDGLTVYSYDSQNHNNRIVKPDAVAVVNSFNSQNQVISRQYCDPASWERVPGDPNTAVKLSYTETRYEYDALGRLELSATMFDPNTTDDITSGKDLIEQREYYPNSGLLARVSIQNEDGTTNCTDYEYDDMGRVRQVNKGYLAIGDSSLTLLESQLLTYENGRVKTTTTTTYGDEGFSITQENIYSADGRLMLQRRYDKNACSYIDTSYTYNASGAVLSQTSPSGKVRYGYDRFGQKAEETEDVGGIDRLTQWVYDQLGRNTQVKAFNPDGADPNSIQITEYDYNMNSQVETITYNDNSSIFYSYNNIGKIDLRTDRNNLKTSYWYDNAGRLTDRKTHLSGYSLDDPNGFAVEEIFSYDALGRMLSAEKFESGVPLSSTSWEYGSDQTSLRKYKDITQENFYFDQSSQLVSETETIREYYDLRDELQSMVLPSGGAVDYNYTALGAIDTMDYTPSGGVSSQIVDYDYLGSNLTSRNYTEPGIETEYFYDELGRRSGLASRVTSTETTLLTQINTLNDSGNIVASDIVASTGGTGGQVRQDIYDYDSLMRLTDYSRSEMSVVTGYPLAHWKFDTLTNNMTPDNSGNGFDAEVIAGSVALDDEGVSGNALSLNTDSDITQVDYLMTDGCVLNPADGPFSLVLWARGGGVSQFMVSQSEEPGTGIGRVWLGLDVDQKLFTALKAPGGSSLITYSSDTEHWHQYVVVWDGFRRFIYVDGVLQTKDYNPIANVESSTGRIIIGNNKGFGATHSWDGQLDDIRIYQMALTGNDIAELYEQYRPQRRGYWRCDDGSGSTLADSSGNGFDGTLNSITDYYTGESVWSNNGVCDGVLEFDGYDDRVTLPADIIDTDQDWSFFTWAYYGGGYGALEIFSQLNGSSYGYSRLLYYDTLSNSLCSDMGGTYTGFYYNFPSTSRGWVHLGVVFYSDYGVVVLYVDGQPIGYNYVSSYQNSNGEFRLGDGFGEVGGSYPYSAPWPGGMDEIEVYQKALSSTEVLALYGNSCQLQYTMSDSASSSTVYDSSVHYHTGTKHGDPQRVAGHSGYALSFDGVDDYITCSKVLNPASGAFSAFAWVKGGGAYQHIICQMDDGGDNGRIWLGVNAYGQFFTNVNAANGTSSNLAVAGTWDSSQWHHLGMVWDGSRRSLYLDGVLVARDSTIISNLLGCNGGLYFARQNSSDPLHFWNGEIDDVKIYRRGFTANEVAQMVAETKRWEYDTLGNRLAETDLQTGIGTSYQANSMNQYSYVDDELLEYDDNGNLELDNRNYTYTYDYENRLAEIWTTDNLIIRNSYDALGRRVMRAVHLIGENGNDFTPLRSDRYYYNDRWQIVRINTIEVEIVNNESVDVPSSREFIYGNGIDEPLFMDLTTGTGEAIQTTRYYYNHDNLGSIVAITNAAGAVVESYKYSPWGAPTIYAADGEVLPESAVENPYLFTAREVDILDDGSLKIQKNRHRDYSYNLASWMQADPLGVVPNDYYNLFDPKGQYGDGFNIYQYVGKNPVRYTDSYGLQGITGVEVRESNHNYNSYDDDVSLGHAFIWWKGEGRGKLIDTTIDFNEKNSSSMGWWAAEGTDGHLAALDGRLVKGELKNNDPDHIIADKRYPTRYRKTGEMAYGKERGTKCDCVSRDGLASCIDFIKRNTTGKWGIPTDPLALYMIYPPNRFNKYYYQVSGSIDFNGTCFGFTTFVLKSCCLERM